MGQLAEADEVHQNPFRPLLLGGFEGVGTAAAGGIDQNIDTPEPPARITGQFFRGVLLVKVHFDDQRFGAARRRDFPGQFLEQLDAPRGDSDLHAFTGKSQRNSASDAARGTRDESGFASKL